MDDTLYQGMAKDLTTDELVKAQAITEFDLQLALDAAEADPDIEMVELRAGYALNLPAALRASSFAELERVMNLLAVFLPV